MTSFVLGLGTNCGDRLSYLRAAVSKLKNEFQVERISSIFESEAMLPAGAPESWQKDFLNLALLCKTNRSAEAVLEKIKAIERELGRVKRERWAPREIDIDILAYDGPPVSLGQDLRLPHLGLNERPFALLPLLELWPNWRDDSGRSGRELAGPWLWQATLPFKTRKTLLSLTQLMSVLNITPDSFSGDGVNGAPLLSLAERLHNLINAGVSVLDIGAESTRPGSEALNSAEEWKRLEPVLGEILQLARGHLKVSLDSRHVDVMERGLDLGVDWINDVTGLSDERMRALARKSKKPVVVMHSLTVPVRKEAVMDDECDPVGTLLAWGQEKREFLVGEGIDPKNIILDPGIGFGKTARQNIHILKNAACFHAWGTQILIGHSRKSFFNELTSVVPAKRDFETAFVSARLAMAGVEFLRVHDPELSLRAFGLIEFT